MPTTDNIGTILLVENSREWCNTVEEIAAEIEADVTCVSNYSAAIRELERVGKYDVAVLDSRLRDNRPKLSQLVQYIADIKGFKPSAIALTNFSDDISDETAEHLVARLKKDDVTPRSSILRRKLTRALQVSAKSRGILFWKTHVPDLPLPKSQNELVTDFTFALTRVSGSHRQRGFAIRKKMVRYFKPSEVPVFDCAGHVAALHDEQIEVVLEIQPGQDEKRSFDRSRFEKIGLTFEGAVFRYQIFEESNGDVRSHLKHWKPLSKEQISYDASVFEQFDATKGILKG